jgi:hypothetical protein
MQACLRSPRFLGEPAELLGRRSRVFGSLPEIFGRGSEALRPTPPRFLVRTMRFGRLAVALRGPTLILRRQPEFLRDDPLLFGGSVRSSPSSRSRLLPGTIAINHLRLACALRSILRSV